MMKKIFTILSIITLMGLSVNAQSVTNNLLGWWKLNSDYTDCSGRGHTLTPQNTPTFAAGQHGNAVTFVSSSSQKAVSDNISELTGAVNFSLSIWMKRSSIGGIVSCIFTNGAFNGHFWGIELLADGKAYFVIDDNSGYHYQFYAAPNDTSWHHFVITFDGTQSTDTTKLLAYVDGSLVTTTIGNGPMPSSLPINQVYSMSLGMTEDAANYNNGSIDSIRLFNITLTSGNVTSLFSDPDTQQCQLYNPSFTLTLIGATNIVNGTSSGSFTNHATVGLLSTNDSYFAQWTGNSTALLNLNDITDPHAILTMPGSNVTFTATYGSYVNYPASFTNNCWISHFGSGSTNGIDSSNTLPVDFLYNPLKWGSTSSSNKIVPGTTIHLVGTITNTVPLQGSGNFTNRITLLFEPNAKISRPTWGTYTNRHLFQPIVSTTPLSNFTIDGGVNGILECTDNGYGLTYTNSIATIDLQVSKNFTIKNITITNITLSTLGHLIPPCNTGTGIEISMVNESTNVYIVSNSVSMVGNAFYLTYQKGSTNINVAYNKAFNMSFGVGLFDNAAGYSQDIKVNHNIFDYQYAFDPYDTNGVDAGCAGPIHNDGIIINVNSDRLISYTDDQQYPFNKVYYYDGLGDLRIPIGSGDKFSWISNSISDRYVRYGDTLTNFVAITNIYSGTSNYLYLKGVPGAQVTASLPVYYNVSGIVSNLDRYGDYWYYTKGANDTAYFDGTNTFTVSTNRQHLEVGDPLWVRFDGTPNTLVTATYFTRLYRALFYNSSGYYTNSTIQGAQYTWIPGNNDKEVRDGSIIYSNFISSFSTTSNLIMVGVPNAQLNATVYTYGLTSTNYNMEIAYNQFGPHISHMSACIFGGNNWSFPGMNVHHNLMILTNAPTAQQFLSLPGQALVYNNTALVGDQSNFIDTHKGNILYNNLVQTAIGPSENVAQIMANSDYNAYAPYTRCQASFFSYILTNIVGTPPYLGLLVTGTVSQIPAKLIQLNNPSPQYGIFFHMNSSWQVPRLYNSVYTPDELVVGNGTMFNLNTYGTLAGVQGYNHVVPMDEWVNILGYDHNSITNFDFSTINSDGTPKAGSAIINAGTNLFALTGTTKDFNGNTLSPTARWTIGAFDVPSLTAPYITVQPTDMSNFTNNPITISITAAGTDPLNYRWYYTNTVSDVLVTNGTDASTFITNRLVSTTNYYYCIITNLYGSVTSTLAKVSFTNSVLSLPIISLNPVDTVHITNNSITLTGLATGTSPLTYFWYYTNAVSDILVTNGINDISFTTNSLIGATNYSYFIVSNSIGFATSSIAKISFTNGIPPVVIIPTAYIGILHVY